LYSCDLLNLPVRNRGTSRHQARMRFDSITNEKWRREALGASSSPFVTQ